MLSDPAPPATSPSMPATPLQMTFPMKGVPVMSRAGPPLHGNGEEVQQLALSSSVAVVDAAWLATWALQTGPATIRGLPSGAQVLLASGDLLGPSDVIPRRGPSEVANRTVCLWRGDITTLRIDGIVNATTVGLLPTQGISRAIHSAAGPALALECGQIGQPPVRCQVGKTVITSGYRLPAKFVLHTVGPTDHDPTRLRSCYESALKVAAQNQLRSVAFCCVAAGICGFPARSATHVALGAIRSWLDAHHGTMDRVVFVTDSQHEHDVYTQLMPAYFPRTEDARPPQGPGADAGMFGGEVHEETDMEVDLFGAHSRPLHVPSSGPERLAAERDSVAAHVHAQGEATSTCAWRGCKRPSWNGMQGEYCSKRCRGSTL